jgi:hypothetical protein
MTELLVEKAMSVAKDKTVARKDCVSREVQQLLLQAASSVKRAKTISREGCVILKHRLHRYCHNSNIGRIVHPYSG